MPKLLSDADVIELRQLAHQNKRPNAAFHSREMEMEVSSIERAIAGKTFKHLNIDHPPFLYATLKKEEEKETRRLYLEEGKTFNEIVDILKISKSSVSKYCKDIKKKPMAGIKLDTAMVEKVRDLYSKYKSGVKVAQELSISQSTVHRHCRDLMDAEQALRLTKVANAGDAPKAKRVSGPQHLTDQNVLDARNEVRATGIKSFRKLGQKYGVSVSTMRSAITGATFKHLDSTVAPIAPGEAERFNNGGMKPLEKTIKRQEARKALLDEAVSLRRTDPTQWTYGNIGRWLSEKTGKNYRAGPTSQLLLKHDPSLKELEGIEQPKKVKEKKPAKKLTPEQLKVRAKQMRDRREEERQRKAEEEEEAAIQRMIELENQREAELSSWTPEERQSWQTKVEEKQATLQHA